MIDIRNKANRKDLIVRYLEAELSLAEEKELVNYYVENKDVDEDEQAFATLIRMETLDASLLSDEGVKEFERIISEAKPNPRKFSLRWPAWVSGIAASVVLFFWLTPSSPQMNTAEMVESIQQVMNLQLDEIVSITTTPIDECVWVKVELKGGTSKTFIMNKDEEKGTTTLLAIN